MTDSQSFDSRSESRGLHAEQRCGTFCPVNLSFASFQRCVDIVGFQLPQFLVGQDFLCILDFGCGSFVFRRLLYQLESQCPVGGDDAGAFQSMLKFADIAWPVVAL